MSRKRKITRFHEEKMRETLKKLADVKSVEGHYGIVDFNYDEFLTYTDNAIRNKTYVSLFLNTLEAQGKITRIRTGSFLGPSRWDVRDFIRSDQVEQQVQQNESEEEPIVLTKQSLDEMYDYLRGLPKHLKTLDRLLQTVGKEK